MPKTLAEFVKRIEDIIKLDVIPGGSKPLSVIDESVYRLQVDANGMPVRDPRRPTSGYRGRRGRGRGRGGYGRMRFKLRCFNCNGTGHMMRDCHKTNSKSMRHQRSRSSDLKCFNCGKIGHYSKDCYVKKSPRGGRSFINVKRTSGYMRGRGRSGMGYNGS